MSEAELPATMPAVIESSAQRLAWARERQDALDERGLVDMQIESAKRVNASHKDEATRIRDARITAANAAMDRAFYDADEMMSVAVKSLQQRQADIDLKVAGFDAALGATA